MRKQNWEIVNRYMKPNLLFTKSVTNEKEIVDNIGNSIILNKNITVTNLLKIEEDTTIDLNGYILNFEVSPNYPGIKNTAKLIIKNGKITSNQVGILNNGELIIDCEIESVNNAINNVYDGKTTINGGSYKNTSTDKALINSNNFGKGTPLLIINGGNFESYFTNISFNNSSIGEINSGIFKCIGPWHNIYIGGETGNCIVNYNELDCSFESLGNKIQVNNWNMNNINTVNGINYDSTEVLLK